jgi:hypothetical protein
MAFIIGNDEPNDQAELELMSGFHQYVQDWLDIINDVDAGERVKLEFDLVAQVRNLQEAGWMLFGKREKRRIGSGSTGETWPVAIVIVAREGTEQVIMHEGDKFLIQRDKLTTGGVAV